MLEHNMWVTAMYNLLMRTQNQSRMNEKGQGRAWSGQGAVC